MKKEEWGGFVSPYIPFNPAIVPDLDIFLLRTVVLETG